MCTHVGPRASHVRKVRFCVLMASRTMTFYICHNNVHGNELVEFSIENLHLVCYTESLVVVVLFLLPHKRGRDLK